jgi:hypothetical protein
MTGRGSPYVYFLWGTIIIYIYKSEAIPLVVMEAHRYVSCQIRISSAYRRKGRYPRNRPW